MWRANKAARPVGYLKKEPAGHTSRKSLASTTMIASGLLLLVFVIVHVKQFKFGTWYQTVGSEEIRDLYRTEIEIFQQPLWVLFYVAGTLLVGLHLRHGIASAFQSLGIDHPVYTRRLTAMAVSSSRSSSAAGSRRSPSGSSSPTECYDAGRENSRRSARREVGSAPFRVEAGQPRQSAQVHSPHRWHRPRRRIRCVLARASLDTTFSVSASRTALAARTASQRREGSTRRRTTRTTATAFSDCSTTRSRGATTARGRRTSIVWPN